MVSLPANLVFVFPRTAPNQHKCTTELLTELKNISKKEAAETADGVSSGFSLIRKSVFR